jgi:hypothetical protein
MSAIVSVEVATGLTIAVAAAVAVDAAVRVDVGVVGAGVALAMLGIGVCDAV